MFFLEKSESHPLEKFLKNRKEFLTSDNFENAKKNLEIFLRRKSKFPDSQLKTTADVSETVRNFQVEISNRKNMKKAALQKTANTATDILASLPSLEISAAEIEASLKGIDQSSKLPHDIVTQISQAESASTAAEFLDHVAACISLTERLRHPPKSPGQAEAELFAQLRLRVSQLHESRSRTVLDDRRELISRKLREQISRSILDNLEKSRAWPVNPNFPPDDEAGRAAVAAAEALVVVQGVSDLEISEIWAAECLAEPLLEKFRVQFASKESPLFRLDKPEWPLRRLIELFIETEDLLNRWGSSETLKLRMAMRLASEARSFFADRWATLPVSLFATYVSKFVHAFYEWSKVDARVAEEVMRDFSTNRNFQVGLLDRWIQTDKEYCVEQLAVVGDIFTTGEGGVSSYALVAIELLTAAIPRVGALPEAASDRLVVECYNYVMVEVVLKRFRTSWNEMPGGLSSVSKACVLVNSLDAIAEHLQNMRADVPAISQEPSRILLHMISRLHQHLHEAFTNCMHRVFSDAAAFKQRVAKPLLEPYQKELNPASWSQLQGYLKASLDDDLFDYLSHNDTREIELLLNCRTNLEALAFDLPKSSAWLQAKSV